MVPHGFFGFVAESSNPEGSGASALRAEIADYIAAHPSEEVAGGVGV